MPIMFFIAYLYMLITYEFDKYFITKHYQKNKEFGEELPLASFRLLSFAILTNLLMSFKVFFNGHSIIMQDGAQGQHFDQISIHKTFYEKISTTHYIVFMVFVMVLSFTYLFTIRHELEILKMKIGRFFNKVEDS
jgi:hypothetical protein